MTTVAIMQPTYLGWVGYFDLIDQADVFILDDTAAVSLKSWQMRNRIRARGGNVIWLSIPTHAHQGQALNTVRIHNDGRWQRKHDGSVRSAYGKTPGWPLLDDTLTPAYKQEWLYLTEFTSHLIRTISSLLGISTPIVQASDLGPTRQGMSQRLVDLVHAVGANVLLDTPGAADFLNQTMLEDIHLQWHHYQPCPYPQDSHTWLSHLSILDLIAHTAENALNIVRNGAYSPTCEPAPQRAP